jgi:hypothetical protein
MFVAKERPPLTRSAALTQCLRSPATVRRFALQLALVLATLSACSTVVRITKADGFPGGCQCGGPSQPYCREMCPKIIEGDCSLGLVGAKCGASDLGECWPGTPDCRPKDAGTSKTDAGVAILYCQAYDNCLLDDAAGGCSVGEEGVARRQVGMPAVLIAGGILVLAIDRRRRRHRHI